MIQVNRFLVVRLNMKYDYCESIEYHESFSSEEEAKSYIYERTNDCIKFAYELKIIDLEKEQ